MTPHTVWIGGQYPAAPTPMLMMKSIIQHNRQRISMLLPLMIKRPGLCYAEIASELGMTPKAVMNKMDRLQLRGVVWFKYESRTDRKGVPRRTRIWFTAKDMK